MDCRKCGAKHITRRRAGVFSCKHCGVQPGPMNLDRAGIAVLPEIIPQAEIDAMGKKPPVMGLFLLAFVFFWVAVLGWALEAFL